MEIKSENPLIVQSDRTLLLEVLNPKFEEARNAISPFAELVKSPEYIHTYRITSLSIWNAAATGLKADDICTVLGRFSKFGVPETILQEIREYAERYGLLKLVERNNRLWLVSSSAFVLQELLAYRDMRKFLGEERTEFEVEIVPTSRGTLKTELIRLGYPVQDIAGYLEGSPLSIQLENTELREYQRQAVDAYYVDGSVYGGNGVLVLPCGAGKTVIAIAAMAKTGMETLVLTSNVTSVRQWIKEIKQRTNLVGGEVGEYTAESKEVKPVTVTTYQMLTYRDQKDGDYKHIDLFNQRNWGLIIYDEVHLLPAPVFRMTADIQAKRRLGLTATLVREDGREEEVFTLVGPKKYDIPWKDLEKNGWIAKAQCSEIRVNMPFPLREEYIYSTNRQKFRVAAENPEKKRVIKEIVGRHKDDQILIIGQYVEQLQELADDLRIPLITGKTPQGQRDQLYEAFRKKEVKQLIVSKVANFAVDLPDANVALQISGTFGSRQEEAQRLGRILRPKSGANQSYFYSIVTKESKEEEFSQKRQMFLVEQGYQYRILDAESFF